MKYGKTIADNLSKTGWSCGCVSGVDSNGRTMFVADGILDTSTLSDHVPQLLDELADALESRFNRAVREALAQGSAPVHGLERFREGYDIEEVVAEYNFLQSCIHDLAQNNGFSLEGESSYDEWLARSSDWIGSANLCHRASTLDTETPDGTVECWVNDNRCARMGMY